MVCPRFGGFQINGSRPDLAPPLGELVMKPRCTRSASSMLAGLCFLLTPALAFATGSEMAGLADVVAFYMLLWIVLVGMFVVGAVGLLIATMNGAIRRPWIRRTLVVMVLVPGLVWGYDFASAWIFQAQTVDYMAQNKKVKDVVLATQPGHLGEVIKRYENKEHEEVMIDTLGWDSAPLNADDQAALEQLNLRLHPRGLDSAAIEVRLMWDREASPGRMAQLLGACPGPKEQQLGCKAALLQRAYIDPRMCVDGHFLPADVGVVESIYSQIPAYTTYSHSAGPGATWEQTYATPYRGDISKWLTKAHTGCTMRRIALQWPYSKG